MVTIVLQGTGGESNVKTTVKADIHATLEELDTIGFNTRFTAMTIENDDIAIMAGAEVTENEYDWVAVRKIATDESLTLTVYDLNAIAGGASSVEITL